MSLNIYQYVQAVQEVTPPWLHWTIMLVSAAASWLAPAASLVALVWGTCQIITWVVNKGWRRKD